MAAKPKPKPRKSRAKGTPASEKPSQVARRGGGIDPSKDLRGKSLTAADVYRLRKATAQELCIKSLFEFLQVAWQFVEPGMPLHLNWHIETIANELEVVYPGVRQEEPPFGWDVFVAGVPPKLGVGGPAGHQPGDVLGVYPTHQEATDAAVALHEALQGSGGALDLELRPSGGVRRIEENWRTYVPKELRPAPLWRNSRLIINIPPGHMKSLLVSVFWPAWVTLREPGHRTLSISGSDRIAIRDSMRTRGILDTNWFRALVQRHFLNLSRDWDEINASLQSLRSVQANIGAGRTQKALISTSIRQGLLGSYSLATTNGSEDSVVWSISRKKDAKASYGTTVGGYRESKALGSKITGERGYGWTLDDPIDVKDILTHGQVDNEVVSARCRDVVDIVDKALDSRVNDMRPGYFYNVIIMQRLHVDDPPGVFYRRMKEGGDFWRFVVARSEHIPQEDLEADEPPNHADDPRAALGAAMQRGLQVGTQEHTDFIASFEETVGNLLFPRRFPREVIEGIKRRLDDQYNAQHGQNPLPGKGGLMAEAVERVRRYIEAPFRIAAGSSGLKSPSGAPLGRMELLITVDATFGSKGVTASNVAIQVWGRPFKGDARGWMYLLDSVAERMTYTETEEAVRAMKRRWPKVRTILIEKKANGATLLERLSSQIPGLEDYDPDGSKEVRAAVLAANMKSGSVCIPAGDPRDTGAVRNGYTPWIDAYVHELVRFPGGSRNDRVDASSSAVIYWTEGNTPGGTDDFDARFRAALSTVQTKFGPI